MRSFSPLLLLILICSSPFAKARVFDINDARFAAYLKGDFGTSSLKQSEFDAASPYGESYSGSRTTMSGGEFGFLYNSKWLGLRLGLEVLKPPTLKVNATDASGNSLYSLSNDLTVVIPKVGLEFDLKKWKESRIYFNINYGQANVEMLNSYSFTSAGTSATGLSNYTEDSKGVATDYDGVLAFESLLSDQTTWAIETGYRQVDFTKLTYNKATTTLGQGAVASGATVLNADGSHRTLNFSGPFVSFMFRIWIH